MLRELQKFANLVQPSRLRQGAESAAHLAEVPASSLTMDKDWQPCQSCDRRLLVMLRHACAPTVEDQSFIRPAGEGLSEIQAHSTGTFNGT